MTESLTDHPNISGASGEVETFYFNVPVDDVYYFGFNAYSETNRFYLFVDDIHIILGPTCIPATGLTVDGVTADTADVSWTPGQDEIEWAVIYGPAGFNPATAGLTVGVNDDPEVRLTGLDDNTADDSSALAGPQSFITACVSVGIPYVLDFEQAAPPAFPTCTTALNLGNGNIWETADVNGPGFSSRVLRYKYHTTNAADTWFFTRGIELEVGVEYRITYKYGNNSNSLSEKMKLAYGTGAAGASMTNELADYDSITGNTSTEEVIVFTVDADDVYYFGFHAYSKANQHYLYLDDIKIVLSSDCDPATDVLVTDITGSSATVSWTESTTATNGYVVEVYLEGEDPATDTPQETETVAAGVTTVDITGLDADTSYDVYVISDCGDDDTAISEVVNFSTIELGVNSNDLTKISYFPNPVKDQLNITAAGKVESVIVTNLLGQTVMQVKPKTTNVVLDMSALPVGTYILQANAESATSTFRVIKE